MPTILHALTGFDRPWKTVLEVVFQLKQVPPCSKCPVNVSATQIEALQGAAKSL